MENNDPNRLIELVEKAWADWNEKGSGSPDWGSVTDELAKLVGCAPQDFVVKVVRQGTVGVRLNETLMTQGVVYPVLICDSSVDLSSAQFVNASRIQFENGATEGVLIISEISVEQPGHFAPIRLLALEHTPLAEKLDGFWPSLESNLIPNPLSIRNSLSRAGILQGFYSNVDSSEMKERASLLSNAALSLQAHMNSNPTQDPVRVKANAGFGRPARSPYLRIFHPSASPNASTGFYVCAFVMQDGKQVFLSVQQPATNGSTGAFKSLAKDQLEQRSIQLLSALLDSPKTAEIAAQVGAKRSQNNLSEINLQNLKASSFSESDVISLVFPIDELPSDTELVRFVKKFLSLASHLNETEGSSVSNDDFKKIGVASKIYWDVKRLQEIVSSLSDESPQVVLAGPPGTGKTYVSRWIASQLLGVPGQLNDPRITTVQFHPTYGYEDFVEGLRPVAQNGSVVFETVPGPIVNLANQILDDGEPRVLIIDEVNRANIARVFGELMYLLEYRDQKIDLMLRKDFVLPKELFIIATMNTADKSTRVMDAALRRRFDFFTIDPDVEVLRGHYESGQGENLIGEELYSGFVKLNQRLEEDLDQHRLIGHSYFMAGMFDIDSLKARWTRQISPLLDEYFYERQAQAGKYKLEDFWPSANS
jgi:hypothetical protein